MSCRFFGMLTVVGLLMSIAPAGAHHAAQAQFDMTKSVALEGTCLRFAWINPHAYMDLEVESNGETSTWRLETIAAAALRRAGLARGSGAIKCSPIGGGDTYKVRGIPARDGSDLALVVDLELPDGRVINLFSAREYRVPEGFEIAR